MLFTDELWDFHCFTHVYSTIYTSIHMGMKSPFQFLYFFFCSKSFVAYKYKFIPLTIHPNKLDQVKYTILFVVIV